MQNIKREAESRYPYEYGEGTCITDRRKEAFIKGAEWMAKKTYSEEEAKNLCREVGLGMAGHVLDSLRTTEKFDIEAKFEELFVKFKKD